MNIPEKAIEATYDMLAKRIMNTMKTVAMWSYMKNMDGVLSVYRDLSSRWTNTVKRV